MSILSLPELLPAAFEGPDDWLIPRPEAARLLAALSSIERVEEGPPARTAAFQAERLRRVLAAASRSSAFWRARVPAGMKRLSDLPILGRADLRAQFDAEGPLPAPPGHGRTQRSATSGSTGQPVVFHISAFNGLYNLYRYQYDVFRQGRDPALPFTAVQPKTQDARADRWPGPLGQFFHTGPFRSIKAIDRTAEEIAALLADEPVGHLVINARLLSGILDLIEAGRVRLDGVGQIATFSETVDDAMRQRARDLLGARIADRYSCEEVGPIAFQCAGDNGCYHIATSNVVVEIVDPDGAPVPPDTQGRVLVTALHGYATPFLRYEPGDLASYRRSCPCGHAGPVLTGLMGRKRSLLRLPDGQRRQLRFNSGDWKDVTPPHEYRIVQTAPTALVLEVVMDQALTADQRAGLRALLQRRSHPDFAIEVRQVERIDWGPGYKRLDVVCLVD